MDEEKDMTASQAEPVTGKPQFLVADLAVGDWFIINGRRYIVKSIGPCGVVLDAD